MNHLNAHEAGDVTRLLNDASQGVPDAINKLLPLVYDELRKMASRRLAGERRITLQATALVHEVYLRLVRQNTIGFEGREAFFSAAATIMRRILVDHARTRQRRKRGGDAVHVTLDEAILAFERQGPPIANLDEAISALAQIDARKAKLVELRFFAGIPMSEIPRLIGVSQRTVERDWRFARAWLHDYLNSRGVL